MKKPVWNTRELEHMTHHDKIDMFIISSDLDFELPASLEEKLQHPHRLSFYLFDYMIEGERKHFVDFKEVTVCTGQIIFLQPFQIHSFPPKDNNGKWFKLIISEKTLAQLRTAFPFLLDPLSKLLIVVGDGDEKRIVGCFRALEEIVHRSKDKNPALIYSYLTTLLTEIDLLYFKKSDDIIHPSDLSLFSRFKLLLNEKLKSQPSVPWIAKELGVSVPKLYFTVKSITGTSPKEYILNRLIAEARRCLFYKELSPKELSYELGFKDPNYFYRVFKKYNGNSVTNFMAELIELSLKSKE